MPITIQDRDIYVGNGPKSQTVKICDFRNNRGEYENYFRIRPPRTNLEAELKTKETLEAAKKWLKVELLAIDEIAKSPVAAGDGEDPPADAVVVSGERPDGDWFREAKRAVEKVIERMVKEFTGSPYMHRVEHCLHTSLVQQLRAEEVFKGTLEIGDGEKNGVGPQGVADKAERKTTPGQF